MRTAVAAPPAEPFEELFAFIDKMTVWEVIEFLSDLHDLVRSNDPLRERVDDLLVDRLDNEERDVDWR